MGEPIAAVEALAQRYVAERGGIPTTVDLVLYAYERGGFAERAICVQRLCADCRDGRPLEPALECRRMGHAVGPCHRTASGYHRGCEAAALHEDR